MVTTVAGILGALLFLVAKNIKLAETLDAVNDTIAYLEDQSLRLLTSDGLTRRIAEIEIRKEVSSREARLQRDIFSELDRLFDSKGKFGG